MLLCMFKIHSCQINEKCEKATVLWAFTLAAFLLSLSIYSIVATPQFWQIIQLLCNVCDILLMRHVMRKPDFCICAVTTQLISTFVYTLYMDSRIPLLLKSKFSLFFSVSVLAGLY